ncbi:methyltransferase domain-containing protein [Colletotrichum musicola]|uniref:Methyltransferase domain-containing protein n=1 Tax=Colletotrichum musicola TaxID=2175873 RepID=A0A8H6NY38_9PEZI|nr:methyltransferase domain-containing protein [Colletotrichum musicola]
MEEAEFVDVEVRMEKWPVGPWPTDSKQKELGRWTRSAIIRGIEGLSLAVFTRLLGWTKEETLVLCAKVRAEAKRKDIRNYFPVYSVWGRKPEPPASP